MKSTEIQLQRVRTWLVMFLLAGSMTGFAQSEPITDVYFTYKDEGKTIIDGLTDPTGQAVSSLTIPATVTKVKSGAFTMAANDLTSLNIESGGNPTFESGLFGANPNTLTMIDMGDGMSVPNMIALLQSLGTFKEGTEIVASGFSGEKDISEDTWDDVKWTNVSSITLPAELIGDQTFGTATVSGRFTIDKEIITFCTSATFADDGNNNMLFYRADSIADDGRLHIQRIDYVVAGEGVLIHRSKSSSGYCDLARYSRDVSYASNLLKGVTSATEIPAEGTGFKNYILKDGAFHPTTGGTVKANKAYLQIPTSAAREMLSISFDDEETTGVAEVRSQIEDVRGEVYDLSGRRVAHPTKGLYITNGKKYVIR